MKQVNEIKDEIKLLTSRLEELKRELFILQGRCEHLFVNNDLMRICSKCDKSESLYY